MTKITIDIGCEPGAATCGRCRWLVAGDGTDYPDCRQFGDLLVVDSDRRAIRCPQCIAAALGTPMRRVDVPRDAHLCPACKLRPRRSTEIAGGLCNPCLWVAVANEGWPDPHPRIIREMRDSGKGG